MCNLDLAHVQTKLHSPAHMAQFLTDCGPITVHGLGVGDPCYKRHETDIQLRQYAKINISA